MDVTSLVLGFVLFSGIAVAVIYLIGIEPAKMVERWLATLANGENLPERPNIGWRYWLYPVHRECLAVAKKVEEVRAGSEKVHAKLAQVEFLQNFVLGSLMEGVMVVDEKQRITLVNSEFMNLFSLAQSPLRRTVQEVMEDSKLDGLVRAAFASGQVEAGRITRQYSSDAGRPPSFEVSAIPVRVSESHVSAVVVLFLPPPDRSRILQVLKRHSEKLQRMASDWTANGGVLLRSSVADLSEFDVPKEPSAVPTAGASSTPDLLSKP